MVSVCAIINPKASRVHEKSIVAEILKLYPNCVYLISHKPKEITRFASKYKRSKEYFIVAGGDGTISLVADKLVGTKCKLVVVPLGTGNLFARSLRINRSVLRDIEKREIIKVDVIKTNIRHFLLSISIGLSAKIIEHSKLESKRVLGMASYFLTWLRFALRIARIHLSLEIDGQNYTSKGVDVVVNNMGLETIPFIDQVTEASPANGILECFILKSGKLFDYIRYIFQEKEAKVANHIIVKDKVEIRFKKRRRIQADGDVLRTEYLEASILPKGLNVVV